MPLQIRRGTNAERSSVVLANGEIAYTTDTQQLYVGDGSTLGGNVVSGGTSGATTLDGLSDVGISLPLSGQVLKYDGASWSNGVARLLDDNAPQLGGNLDTNTYNIFGTGTLNSHNESGTPKSLISLLHNDNNTNSSSFTLARSRGSNAAPTSVVDTDQIFSFSMSAHDGTSYVVSSAMSSVIDGAVSTGVVPSKILFATTNSTGTFSSKVAINPDGRLSSLEGGFETFDFTDGPTNSYNIALRRSRGSLGSPSSVTNGDRLSDIISSAWDGANFTTSAAITTSVDGAVSTGVVPGKIFFATADSAGSVTTAVTISADGKLSSLRGGADIFISGDTSGGSGNLALRRSRGTSFAPTATLSADTVYNLVGSAYDGSQFTTSTVIGSIVDGTVSNGIVPGKIFFATANTSGAVATRVTIDNTGKLNVLNGLNIETTQTNSDVVIVANGHNSGTDASNLSLRRSRNSVASPSAVQTGDVLFDINYGGHDGTTYQTAVSLRGVVVGSVASGQVAGQLVVRGRVQGSTSFATFMTADSSKVAFTSTPKFPVYADTTARDTAISSPEAGMVIFLTATSKLQVNVDGTTGGWQDLN